MWPAPEFLPFIERNLVKPRVLEIGCGSGRSFEFLPITAAAEPCAWRCKAAKARGNVDVRQAFAECLPWPQASFDSVLFMLGFFQVRCDYEALIEINRALRIGGVFIFNLQGDEQDYIVGRALGPRNFQRICKDFGFEPVEVRTITNEKWSAGSAISQHLFAVRKEREFRWQALRKMQLVRVPGGESLYKVLNADFGGRDRQLQ